MGKIKVILVEGNGNFGSKIVRDFLFQGIMSLSREEILTKQES
ncbi:MAG: hypothetical protein ACFFD7_14945 [Candidatus Thorarchaeota archaeon]